MTLLVDELVEAGIYPNEEAALQEALRVLWQERPGIRIDVAVYQYRTEDISLAKAAAIAGVSLDRIKEVLSNRGVPLRLGPATIEEAWTEIKAFQKMRA